MLHKLGYVDITVADDGQYAIDYIQKDLDKYNILLLDLKMPRVSGLEVAKRVDEMYLEAGKEKPKIIALTAVAMSGDKSII